MYLIFSHNLTKDQEEDAKKNLKIDRFIYMPDELKNIWGNINPYGELPIDDIQKIKDYIYKNAKKGDYILIQGDFWAVYNLVKWCFEKDFIPVYSTTKRVHDEKDLKNGQVESRKIFKHVNFRRYQ
ncbi:MAG: CRISPR-associated protein Csx20 [Caloramator sp.]|nr:CRISPR-associated protein Csx20 [Caloramator sp.]